MFTIANCNNNFGDQIFPPLNLLNSQHFDIESNAIKPQTVNGSYFEDLGLLTKAYIEMIKALDILASSGWNLENTTHSNDVIESKFLKGIKILRIKAVIDTSPDTLASILYDKFETQPKWNPTVIDCRVVKTIDSNTDITYTVTAPACQGLVGSRDLVMLRHRAVVENSCIIASVSIDSHLVPVNKYIRAENGPSCFVITPVSNDSNRCELRWLLNTNLNGWLPLNLVNMALSMSVEDFLKNLRKFISKKS